MNGFLVNVTTQGEAIFGAAWPVVWNLAKIVALLLPLMGCVAYLTLWERKLIGWMHVRRGPNRVGPFGLLQPIADAVKLLFKEVLVPAQASRTRRRDRRARARAIRQPHHSAAAAAATRPR